MGAGFVHEYEHPPVIHMPKHLLHEFLFLPFELKRRAVVAMESIGGCLQAHVVVAVKAGQDETGHLHAPPLLDYVLTIQEGVTRPLKQGAPHQQSNLQLFRNQLIGGRHLFCEDDLACLPVPLKKFLDGSGTVMQPIANMLYRTLEWFQVLETAVPHL
jgi:hypothetical protein